VIVLQSVGAGLLLLGTVLILRACWRMDQPLPKAARRIGKVRTRQQVAETERAA